MSKINKIRLSGTDYDIQDVSATSVVELTQQQYDDLPASAKTDNILYIITDSTVDYVTSAQTQSAITQAVSGKVDTNTYNTYTAATDTALNGKQDTLVSSQNIKTINNESLLGSGNIDIQGGNSVVELTQAAYDALVTGGTVDPDTFYIITDAEAGDLTNYYTKSETNTLLGGKQDTLVSSVNIKTINNESILGSGNITIQGGGKAIEAGRGISITTGETADTVSLGFPIWSGGSFNSNVKVNSENNNINYGSYSFASGSWTKVGNKSEFASGSYNVSNKANTTWGDSGNTLFSVGNGTADNARHNAFEIRQNGDIYLNNGTSDVKLQDTITATAANTTALGGLKLVKLTQSAYDALSPDYDANTLYVING